MAELSAHPYILSIHDAGVTSTGLGYIVLEYAPGGSYKELIRKRPLTADQMLDLGIKLCSALFTAHCKGILHRDIKPANILITPQGLPVLADFGISTNVYQAGTQTGFSVPWAAPEVLTGRSGGTEAADIYSLAATLYATLTGRSPYEHGYQAHTQQELAQVIVSRRLPPIGALMCPRTSNVYSSGGSTRTRTTVTARRWNSPARCSRCNRLTTAMPRPSPWKASPNIPAA